MKKNLLIFDLNQTLMYVAKSPKVKTFDYTSILSDKKPDVVVDQQKVFFRPARNEFLNYLFMKSKDSFEIGVWSSLDREKTAALTKAFFERYYRK